MRPHLVRAMERVASHLPREDEETMRAWRLLAVALRRGERASSQTLPRLAGLAQHAVLARELLDQLVPVLPPTLYATAADARTHIVAILSALSPGTDSEPPERGMET
ncbi:MAG: hypothetical protein VYE22_09990 [Myxococcota bacterium]|nr:hypothetical protein [Myxococcota bacterium]